MLRRPGTTLLLAASLLAAAARADKKPPPRAAEPARAASPAPKVKSYDFSGLDVQGRLKTPQLLYFLNRMQAEFDSTTPARRSFMPELKRSADEL